MIGNNTLTLNASTVMAALQMYLDSQRKPEAPAIVVKSVKASSTGGYPPVFEVEISSEVPNAR